MSLSPASHAGGDNARDFLLLYFYSPLSQQLLQVLLSYLQLPLLLFMPQLLGVFLLPLF